MADPIPPLAILPKFSQNFVAERRMADNVKSNESHIRKGGKKQSGETSNSNKNYTPYANGLKRRDKPKRTIRCDAEGLKKRAKQTATRSLVNYFGIQSVFN